MSILQFLLAFLAVIGVIGSIIMIVVGRTDGMDGGEINLRPIGIGVLILVPFMFWLAFASFYSVPPDKIALHYSGGPFQGAHFKEIITPGTSLKYLGESENVYYYPATTRNYVVDAIAGQGDRKTADFIATTSSDKVEADWNIAVSFRLNTEPSVLRKFHESLGLKFNAWTEGGWNTLLDQTLRQVIENQINSESSKYPLEQLYADPQVRLQIQAAVGRDLTNGVNNLLGGKFFCGPNATIAGKGCPPMKFIIKGRPTIPTSLRDQFERNRAAELAVQQRQSEVEQAKKQAEAAEALRLATQNNPNYILLKAIESGQIKFWVLPQNGQLNLTAPTP